MSVDITRADVLEEIRDAIRVATAPYLRRHEAARLLSCDPRTFDRVWRRHLTPVIPPDGAHELYRRDEIDALIAKWAGRSPAVPA